MGMNHCRIKFTCSCCWVLMAGTGLWFQQTFKFTPWWIINNICEQWSICRWSSIFPLKLLVRPCPIDFPVFVHGSPQEFECPPCPPVPKARERPLMISAEDEPPGRAPRVEVNVTDPWDVGPAFRGLTGTYWDWVWNSDHSNDFQRLDFLMCS